MKVFFSQCGGFEACGKRPGGCCGVELFSRCTEGLAVLYIL